MSPLLPPEGVEVLMYLVPNPFELDAIEIVLFVDKSPPPLSPDPAEITVAAAAAPKLVRALVALVAPVPPSTTAIADASAEIDPPVIETLLAF
jgi:hypothetical protein